MQHSAGQMSVVDSLFYSNTAGSDNIEDGEIKTALMHGDVPAVLAEKKSSCSTLNCHVAQI